MTNHRYLSEGYFYIIMLSLYMFCMSRMMGYVFCINVQGGDREAL